VSAAGIPTELFYQDAAMKIDFGQVILDLDTLQLTRKNRLADVAEVPSARSRAR
jgi:hypothetical protein